MRIATKYNPRSNPSTQCLASESKHCRQRYQVMEAGLLLFVQVLVR